MTTGADRLVDGSCPECGRVFIRMCHLARHRSASHGIEPAGRDAFAAAEYQRAYHRAKRRAQRKSAPTPPTSGAVVAAAPGALAPVEPRHDEPETT